MALKVLENIHVLLQIAFQGCLAYTLCAVSSEASELEGDVPVGRAG